MKTKKIEFANGNKSGTTLSVFANTLEIHELENPVKIDVGELYFGEIAMKSRTVLEFHKTESIDVMIKDLKHIKKFLRNIEKFSKKIEKTTKKKRSKGK